MQVSVIIVNYNVKYFLEVCLHSIYRAINSHAVEVIVVDNNSADSSCEMVKSKFPGVKLIANTANAGFSKANNQGVAIATGKYILFLNPDTVMPEDFFDKTIAYMESHPKAGALGPRLIDGKGIFAPDAKKGFPTLPVALFKTTGINKLFPRSAYFNRYYAVHIKEHEVAEVEVLSGCCMLVRKDVIDKIGGAFDEDYFMYCEDVDLSYRINKAGYQNIYYPEVNLIHYKGESTRKMTLTYIRIFNEALITFVKKHYSQKDAQLFIFIIKIGIAVRALLGIFKATLKALHMPLPDAVLLLATLMVVKDFWVNQVIGALPIPAASVYATFPAYILIWILSLFFNNAYDNPYSALKVVRGMAIGTIATLAYYGLLPAELRYSRAIILLTGISGTALLIAMHEILYRLGILKYIPYNKLPKKAVIVGSQEDYAVAANLLEKVPYPPELAGRIETGNTNTHSALDTLPNLRKILFMAGIEEVIFCMRDISYATMFRQMEACGAGYEYKIHLIGSGSFVGSNSSHTSGDIYSIDKRYKLAEQDKLRSKRMIDIIMALVLLLATPLLLIKYRNFYKIIAKSFIVLAGISTWIGYAPHTETALPKIKKGVLFPYNILPDYSPEPEVVGQLNMAYAQHYSPLQDIKLLLNNLKYIA
ncbi:MAG: glycosyltransferase [Chitinophagia bacterium]|nr:glycosyltransferase [Chitinophagia bacterium]